MGVRGLGEGARDVGDLRGRGDLVVGYQTQDLPVPDLLRDEVELRVDEGAVRADQLDRGQVGPLGQAQERQEGRVLDAHRLVGGDDDLGASVGGQEGDAGVGDHGCPSKESSAMGVSSGSGSSSTVGGACDGSTGIGPGTEDDPLSRRESRWVLM